REAVGVLARRERAELDERIARQHAVLGNSRREYSELSETALAGHETGQAWLERHGVDIEEAAALELELAQRRERAWRDAAVRARYEPTEQLVADIGERPGSLVEAELWDQAAAALEDYRLRTGESPDPGGPPDPALRGAWERARSATAELRQLQGHDVDPVGAELARDFDGRDIDL
ncbi:MAG: hypothetical protein M3417_13270, partial [Actinomycetota bacterium]|nr:hypothetical protein [Actinomycetota bacterium]